MLIQEKSGHLSTVEAGSRHIDRLDLEWYETGKRIMRKQTRAGREIALKFLAESPALSQDDILYADDQLLIVVEILPCETMVIPMSSLEMTAAVCYETGNRHLPLYIEGNLLLAPFEEPLYRWLSASGYAVSKEMRQLLSPLRSTVSGHSHSASGSSLFSKIMQLTK